MGPKEMPGRLVFLTLLLVGVAYLPPPEELDWLRERGVPVARCLPATLHVTHIKVPIFRGACVLLAALLFLEALRRRKMLRLTREEALLLAFAALCAASGLWAGWARGWRFRMAPLVFSVAWAILVGRLAAREECERIVLKGILWAGLAAAAFGLTAFLCMWAARPSLIANPTFRLAVPHKSNANFAAAILVTPMFLAWHAAGRGGRGRGAWVAAGCGLTLCILLTRSESGMIGVLCGAIALAALVAPAKWRRRIVGGAIAIVLAGVVALVAVPGGVQWAVEGMLQGTRAVRYFFWQDALRMIGQRPAFGWGVGGFFFAYPQFRQPDEFLYPQLRRIVGDHAHNELLDVGVELGVAGMALACVFLFLLIGRSAGRIGGGGERRWREALVAGTVAMLAQSCFCPSLRSWDVGPFFWTQIGLLMALARARNENAAEEQGWTECGAARLVGLGGIVLAGAVACGAWCNREWRGEAALAKGLLPDVGTKAGAAAAEPYLREGVRLTMNAPYWFNAKRRLAICLRTQGDLGGAIAVLQEIDREVPNLGTTRMLLGELHFARFLQTHSWMDHAKALDGLMSYASANYDAEVCLKIVKVLQEGKPQPETVRAYLKACLLLDPDNAEAKRLLAEVDEAPEKTNGAK